MYFFVAMGLVSIMGIVTIWHVVRTIRSGVNEREWELRQQAEGSPQPGSSPARV